MIALKNATLRVVPEDRIVAAPFRLSWTFDPGPLQRSIEHSGLIAPLVLRPRPDGFSLVCGHRRLTVLRALGRTETPAWLFPAETPAADLLDLALLENLSHRTLSEAEKALAVSYLAGLHPAELVVSHYLPLLGLPPKQETMQRYLTLARMGPATLTALAGGKLDPETAASLGRLTEADRDALINILDRLGAGRNKQRQIITWLMEISRREDAPEAEILAEPVVQAILDDDKLSRPDKEKRLRAYLYGRRYPKLSRLEAQQAALTAGLKLPAKVRLDPPQAFEGLDFQARLTFADRAEYEAGLRALSDLAGRPEFDALLDLG